MYLIICAYMIIYILTVKLRLLLCKSPTLHRFNNDVDIHKE